MEEEGDGGTGGRRDGGEGSRTREAGAAPRRVARRRGRGGEVSGARRLSREEWGTAAAIYIKKAFSTGWYNEPVLKVL